MKRCCFYIVAFLLGQMIHAQIPDVYKRYGTLSNSDSVCYVFAEGHWNDSLIFLRDDLLYCQELNRSYHMDYNTIASDYGDSKAMAYNGYVLRYHAVLTDFVVQLLTYEERQALLDKGMSFRFSCAVNKDGRVWLIPRFVLNKGVADVFTVERLYELSRLIKDNAVFPPPPAGMTFASMFLTVYINNKFLEEGVFYEPNLYNPPTRFL